MSVQPAGKEIREGKFFYPWERTLDRLVTPFEEFIHRQTTSGMILLAASIVAVMLANSPLRNTYLHLTHSPVIFRIGGAALEMSWLHLVNEGLMVLFFFVVGLEIKREILVGELSETRKALLPILAALGGMLTPALLYGSLNFSGDFIRGWGIPVATDIAFCVSALVLLGRHIPQALTIFLVSLAIVDDIGAVIVIAIFYTQSIDLTSLGWAALVFAVLVAFNLSGVRRSLPFALAGIVLWVLMYKSGVHATITGILVAFCIPARSRHSPEYFRSNLEELIARYRKSCGKDESVLTNMELQSVLNRLDDEIRLADSPLRRMEDRVHLPVALLVIPIFALTNAGIEMEWGSIEATLRHPVTLGVVSGLFLGKMTGIFLFSWAGIRLGWVSLPSGVNLRHLLGVGFLGGIGFTMSIFIAELSFPDNREALLMAKSGIMVASLLSALAGYLWLRFLCPKPVPARKAG
jgi:Na+:H+ antiporter, NhaA family